MPTPTTLVIRHTRPWGTIEVTVTKTTRSITSWPPGVPLPSGADAEATMAVACAHAALHLVGQPAIDSEAALIHMTDDEVRVEAFN